ncbi:MAG: hypothetical protein GY929_15775 [Actinomycetia bacterium]|nr:hypothetical protein [Actinomycetes bacterium]
MTELFRLGDDNLVYREDIVPGPTYDLGTSSPTEWKGGASLAVGPTPKEDE